MLNDFRYSLRALSRIPGFTAIVVLSLGLGIAANTTVLCWIQNLLYNPIPGAVRQDEFVVIKSSNGGGNISYLDNQDLAALDKVFDGSTVSQLGAAYFEWDQHTEWIYGQVTTAGYFDFLGVKPLLGRTFLPGEDKAFGGNPVVVLSERCWVRHFERDPAIVGKKVLINRQPFTVIGVVPAEFQGTMTGLRLDFWAPVSMCGTIFNYEKSYLDWRGARPWHNLFRLKPGVSMAQAQAAVDGLDLSLRANYPRSNEEVTHQVLPLAQCPYGAQSLLLSSLELLLCVSLLVLLIVAANVANLLLSRMVKREKEIAIRLSAGASRIHIVRLFLAESMTLSLLGGVVGLVFSFWTIDLLSLFIPAADLPVGALDFPLRFSTLLSVVGLTLITGLLIGLFPAFQVSRMRLNDALKDGGKSSLQGSSHHQLRNSLIVAEVALSVVLIVSASLCIKGFAKAEKTSPGFEPRGILLGRLSIGVHGYDERSGVGFYERLQRALQEQPGVEKASLASFFPLGFDGCKGIDASAPGRVRPEGESSSYERTLVSSGFFDTFQIPFVEGRDFNDADGRDKNYAVIVNDTLAERFWPGQSALGRSLRSHGRDHTVVGVVKTIKFYRMNEKPRCHLYFFYKQWVPELDLNIALKVSGDPKSYANLMRNTVKSVDPQVAVRTTETMTDHSLAALFATRIATSMLSLMGAVALALAAMGIYAVMAYSVNQRISEFGIRAALGASRANILSLVVGQGLRVVLLGIVSGLGLALLVTRMLSDFLYGVSPFDFLTFALVPLFFALVGAAACLQPALKATRVQPVDALRTN